MLIKKYSLLFSILLLVTYPAFATPVPPTNVQINEGSPSGVLLSMIEDYPPSQPQITFYTTPSSGSIFVLTSYSTNCTGGLIIGSTWLAETRGQAGQNVITFPAGIQVPANTALATNNNQGNPCSIVISGVLAKPHY